MDVRVGLCGFSMAMQAYASRFPVVEVQATFYQPPSDAVVRKWRVRTGPALEYTVKVWQLVTHPPASPTYRRMKRPLAPGEAPGSFRASAAVREGWLRSLECARLLDATALLFQCPASFGPDPANVRAMRRFFATIERPDLRLLWEPRGRAWVEQRALALALCDELGLTHVVDPFVTPPAAGHPVYWRLHGPGSAYASYADDELRALLAMLQQVAPEGPAYVLFNNLPRVGDAQRFAALVAASRAGR
jgi:uncharacterized protein YecE (DUF72 family)